AGSIETPEYPPGPEAGRIIDRVGFPDRVAVGGSAEDPVQKSQDAAWASPVEPGNREFRSDQSGNGAQAGNSVRQSAQVQSRAGNPQQGPGGGRLTFAARYSVRVS